MEFLTLLCAISCCYFGVKDICEDFGPMIKANAKHSKGRYCGQCGAYCDTPFCKSCGAEQ